MEEIIYVLKIIIYFILVFFLYFLTLKSSKIDFNEKKRVKLIIVILFCILFGFYSLICGQYPYSSDRGNFAFRFEKDMYLSYVKSESYGLFLLEKLLHLISHDPKILFFSVAFIYLFLTLLSYDRVKDKEPFALLIIGLSAYFSYGFYMLKQCIAIGFIALSFAEYSKKKIKQSIVCIFFAILFHESAWIIIPVYLAMSLNKNNFFKIMSYILLICCALFFSKINIIIINIFSTIVPSLSSQMSIYLDNNGSLQENLNTMTILKGLPFYFILLFGLLNRKQLKYKIEMYDKYMFLTFFVSIATILSMFMYWMFRFATYCYFPVFIFSSLILRELENEKDRSLFSVSLILILFILTLRMWYQYYFWYGGI
ncbi:MAG: EpsG family protein [Bacilli bacterium]|nr:EpsG family protein [Bacilli bacterium]